MTVRWIFAGQLGELFDDGGRVLLIESRSVLRRRIIHRAKAHLILSAIRHRAAELGDRVEFHQVDEYEEVVAGRTDLEVVDPTSYGARRTVRRLGARILPSRGFINSEEQFAQWAATREGGRLLLEDFYRATRMRTGILMEGESPAGGQWNYDIDNRAAPPAGLSPSMRMPVRILVAR
jgi:deoxyribodipyrimidine photolyase-related protein